MHEIKIYMIYINMYEIYYFHRCDNKLIYYMHYIVFIFIL